MARSSKSSSSSSSSSSSNSSRFTSSSVSSVWSTSHTRIPLRENLPVRILAYAAGASPTSDTIRIMTKETPERASLYGDSARPERLCFWVEDPHRDSLRTGRPDARSAKTTSIPRRSPPPMPRGQYVPRPNLGRGASANRNGAPNLPGAAPRAPPEFGRGRPPLNRPAPMGNAIPRGPPQMFRPQQARPAPGAR
jgi:hypothetical protein